jgi:molybdopterin converting factor small subunit
MVTNLLRGSCLMMNHPLMYNINRWEWKMKTKVHLYSGLYKYVNHQDIVEATGNTVGECLHDVARQYPDIKPQLFDDQGQLLSTVMISINLQSQYKEGLDRQISPGDEIYVILIIPGG